MTEIEKQKPNYFELRAYPNHEDRYDLFIENKIICLGWPEIGNLQDLRNDLNKKEEIKKLLISNYSNLCSYTKKMDYFYSVRKMKV